MQVSNFGLGNSYHPFGTSDVLRMLANSTDPNADRILGIQQTLQAGTGEYDNLTSLLAYNTALSNLKPGTAEYIDLSLKRNALLFGGPSINSQALDNLSNNPKLQFAAGALLAVRQFLGV